MRETSIKVECILVEVVLLKVGVDKVVVEKENTAQQRYI